MRRKYTNDGDRLKFDPWHAVVSISGDPAILCTGEFTSVAAADCDPQGETSNGPVTCRECARELHEMLKFKISHKLGTPIEAETGGRSTWRS